MSMMQRVGVEEETMLNLQGNLSLLYQKLGRLEEAFRMRQHVYSRRLRLNGVEDRQTLIAASNYANSLVNIKRFEEAKSVLRKMMPVARRVLGVTYELTLRMKWNYARALYTDTGATLDDLREAVTTLAETERTARRVFGGAHPTTKGIQDALQNARALLRAREGDDVSSVCEAVEKMMPGDA